MSVVERSCFSYQVAAGRTTSESSVVDVIRKIGADEQVELSLRNVVAPYHLGGPHLGRRLCRHQVRVGAQQVLEEVLVALSRRAQQVGPPEDQGAWPVPRGVDVLDRELQASVDQPSTTWATGSATTPASDGRRRCLVGEIERVAVELGVERHPAHAAADWRSCRQCACQRGVPRRAGRPGVRPVPSKRHWSVCMYQYDCAVIVRGGVTSPGRWRVRSTPLLGGNSPARRSAPIPPALRPMLPVRSNRARIER
jgi:hypothetical protein